MRDKIRTGILAFGMSGKLFHAPFLEVHKGFELYAIVERTKKEAQLKYPNIKTYNSIETLLEDNSIELVVVNTPSRTHYEYALKAIKANKHVVVEKPFTITSAQAKHLFDEAKKNNCYLLPYQNRRYDSDYLSVKNVLDSGKLGKLLEVHFRYDRYKYKFDKNTPKEASILGNGVLYNLGPHLIDAAISLFGIPLNWSKKTEYHRPKSQIDDFMHLHLIYPEGLNVFLTSSLLVADPGPAFILHGSKGSYSKQRTDVQEKQLQMKMNPDNIQFGKEVQGNNGVLTLISSKGLKTKEKMPAIKSSYLNIYEAIYQTIKKENKFPITKKQIIEQMIILES